jgi:glycosyltransferase involved in cell wall biosynthesis
VHQLGVVPRSDVYDLIRQSLCVVNPSLFEGWGYAVDEAAAVGKQILASDIAAHRAQQAPACELFNATDTEGLAAKLANIEQTATPGPSLALEAAARRRMPERVEVLGRTLFEVLSEAVAVHHNRARP